MKFVKTANRFKKNPKDVKTGIDVKVDWVKKIEYLFKKKLSILETLDYFYKVLTNIKFIDDDNKTKTM